MSTSISNWNHNDLLEQNRRLDHGADMAPILSVSRAQSLPVGAHHHNPRQRQQQRLSPYGSTRKHAHAKACPPTRPVRTVDPVMDGHDDDSMTLGSMPSFSAKARSSLVQPSAFKASAVIAGDFPPSGRPDAPSNLRLSTRAPAKFLGV